MITVLLVDNHFIVRIGFTALLEIENDIRVVATADTSAGAAELYGSQRPSVTLIDLDLPGLEGFDAITSITAIDPDARTLACSTFVRADEIRAALAAGARGYLKKSSSRKVLIHAIRSVAAGKISLPQDLSEIIVGMEACSSLTGREREVVKLISEGSSNRVIGITLGIAEDTVKQHVSRLLQKLEVKDRAHAATKAIRLGIIRPF